MGTWPLLRDIAITGTGLIVIASQVLIQVLQSRAPSELLLGVGLALTTPSAAAHVRTILAGAGPSSHSSPPSGSSHSSRSRREATRD